MEPNQGKQAHISMHCFYAPQGTSIAYRNQNGFQDVGYITGGTPTQLHFNVEVKTGSIQIMKRDQETGEKPQGEALLKQAKYALIDDKTGKSKGELIIQDNLFSNVIKELPTDRTYSLKEIQAPQGYQLSSDVTTVDLSQQKDVRIAVKDKVITGSFRIHKIYTDGKKSEVVHSEKGAEFGVVLKKHVDQYGDVKKALAHKSQFSSREWDTMTTNQNGYASSKKLAYGTYVVAQLSGPKHTEWLKESFMVTIDGKDKEPAVYTINNRPQDYYLKLVKKDANSHQVVQYSSARFKVYDENGKKVSMKVGSQVYDTFATASQTTDVFEAGTFMIQDKKGEVMLPLRLNAGRYRIEEIQAPQGYLLMKKPVWIQIESDYVTKNDSTGDPYVEVDIVNEKVTGTLILKKEFEESDGEECTQPVLFQLFAKEDILDPVDGSLLYKAGAIVSLGDHQDGIYALDKEGTLKIEGLPMGVKKTVYHLKEIQTREGYQLPEQGIDFEFDQKDSTTREYVIQKKMKNHLIHLSSQVFNPDHKTVVFDKNKKMIIEDKVSFQGLDPKKQYRLSGQIISKKTGQPVENEGKILQQDILFIPKENQQEIKNTFELEKRTLPVGEYVVFETLYCEKGHILARHEELEDEKQSFQVVFYPGLRITKTDGKTGKPILDKEFSFALYKKGEKEQTSIDGELHKEKGMMEWEHLEPGTYVLRETKAPKGYQLSSQMHVVDVKEKEIFVDGQKLTLDKEWGIMEIENHKIGKIPTGVSSTDSFAVLGLVVSMGIVWIQILRSRIKK